MKRLHHIINILIIIISGTFFLRAQQIPEAYQTSWENAGLENEFGTDYKIIRLSEADLGTSKNISSANDIQTLIDSLPETGHILLFDTGKYIFHHTLVLKKNLIIKAAEIGKVVFEFDLKGSNGPCISVYSSSYSNYVPVKKGFYKGSRTLYLENTANFKAGDYAEIVQNNGIWDIAPADWAANAVGQILKIKAVKDNTLELYEPLRLDYDRNLEPRIRVIEPISNVGIEGIVIKRLDPNHENPSYNIIFNYAVNCYVRGVESHYSQGSHIMISRSAHIEVSGCYIHKAFAYDGYGTQGYGICLNHHAGDCLVENNIFEDLRHAMMVKAGANGNVFSYNFSTGVYREEFPHDASGDLSLHGHFAYANLFEGNIAENLIIDHYWGPSGPRNTFFRNRLTAYGIIMTKSQVETDSQLFIANEVVNPATFYGFYFLTGSGHFEYGNIIKGKIYPAANDKLDIPSLYYPDRPSFMNEYPWPPIGLPNRPNEHSIPAADRYNLPVKTVIKTEPITSSDGISNVLEKNRMVEAIYPNPFQNSFIIKLNSIKLHCHISISDIKGKTVYSHTIFKGSRELFVNFPENLPAGIYFVKIVSTHRYEMHKIFKTN